ncbi:MAG: DUF4886 domain-containing protein [Clostridia bacterium]|nr:DUF4886 domain-containing protein [Clostridia bacterium]
MIKILALGNSFSQDATAYLQPLCKDAYVRNLDIGGCSLERHANNLTKKTPDYHFEENGVAVLQGVTANEMIASEKWDFITVQQVSGLSGVAESYEPHIGVVLAKLRALCPSAKIVFHQTWSYAKERMPYAGETYGGEQKTMDEKIRSAVETVTEKYRLPRIETGEYIRKIRDCGEFENAPLYRDGYHLSFEYGRYVAALAWAKFFGLSVDESFTPENADKKICEKLRAYIFQ